MIQLPRRLQFRLRSLFLLVTICTILVGLVANEYRTSWEQRQNAKNLMALGISRGFVVERRKGGIREVLDNWLWRRISPNLAGDVTEIALQSPNDMRSWSEAQFRDVVRGIESLPNLRVVSVEAAMTNDAQLSLLQEQFPQIQLKRDGRLFRKNHRMSNLSDQ